MNRHERRQKNKQVLTAHHPTTAIEEAMVAAAHYSSLRDFAVAKQIYGNILATQPHHTNALCEMAIVCHMLGEPLETSLGYIDKAISLQKNNITYHLNKGTLLARNMQMERAIISFQRCLELSPKDLDAAMGLATAYEHLDKFDDAIRIYEQILTFSPNHYGACNNLATLRRDTGRIEEAFALYRHSLNIAQDPIVHSNFLICMHYNPKMSTAEIFAEHREWNRRYVLPIAVGNFPHYNRADPDRKLKIGYVSADFRNHPVSRFLLPTLANHDTSQVEVHCYSAVVKEDSVTDTIRM